MDQAAKIADLVAHQSPEQLARALLDAEARCQSLQTDNDRFLFDAKRVDREAKQQPAKPVDPKASGDDDAEGDDDDKNPKLKTVSGPRKR